MMFGLAFLKALSEKARKSEGLSYRTSALCPWDILGLIGLTIGLYAFLTDKLGLSALIWLYVLIIFSAVSADMDYHTKMVYGWLIYPPVLYGTVVCIIQIFSGRFVLPADLIFELLPLIFTIATFKTRGFADTVLMTGYCLYGLCYGNPLTVMIGFLIGYMIQSVVHVRTYIKTRKKGLKFPFIPALFLGFICTITLDSFILL
ncbi:MAG: hypothetical protein K6E95_00660 [Lachnospiraceae bacterium]|nr:hypothetical protein [Lachnospiraceae bacterium]